MPAKILKPDERDADYGCDDSGHYLLAIDDGSEGRFARLTESQRDELARYVQTPVGAYRPLPQARKFHRSRKRRRWALGGNRSSKSHALAMETIWRATGGHPFRRDLTIPSVGWYATTTWPKLGELYRTKLAVLLRGIPHRVIWHNRQLDIPAVILVDTEKGQSRIECKAFEQGRDSFQAAALNYIHFDEQFGQDIFLESITRIGAEQEADFAAAMTPIVGQPWLEDRLVTDRERYAATDDIFEFPLDDNRDDWGGFIPAERILALIEEWPPEVRETRRRGRWGAYLGAIFQTFSRDVHVVDEAKEQRCFFLPGRTIPATIGAIDWGGSNPFVFLWACRIPHMENEWYVFDELYWNHRDQGARRLDQLAEDIKGRSAQWKTTVQRTWADHDPTNILTMAHHGVPAMPAVKVGSPDEISRAGIEEIQTLLNPRPHLASDEWKAGRPRLHIAARCKNLIREMGLYRWAESSDPDKKSPKDVPVKANDHAVDALRYLIHSERPLSAAAAVVDIGSYARRFR